MASLKLWMRVLKNFPGEEGGWSTIWSYHLEVKKVMWLCIIQFRAIKVLITSEGWAGSLSRKVFDPLEGFRKVMRAVSRIDGGDRGVGGQDNMDRGFEDGEGHG